MTSLIDFYPIMPSDVVEVLPGHTAVIEFEMGSRETKSLLVKHTSDTMVQDWTLRARVSRTKGGVPVVRVPAEVCEWNPDRAGQRLITPFDPKGPRPDATRPLPLVPGTYYICVSNSTNAPNSFTISLTNIPSPAKPIS